MNKNANLFSEADASKLIDFSLQTLVKNILEKVPRQLRHILSVCAIPHEISAPLLKELVLLPSEQEAKEILYKIYNDYSLFTLFPGDVFKYHDEIRNAFLSLQNELFSREEWRELNNIAKNYYQATLKVLDNYKLINVSQRESVYHDLVLGNANAFENLVLLFENYRNNYLLEDSNALLTMSSEPIISLDESQKSWLAYFKMNVSLMSGNFLIALEGLESALKNNGLMNMPRLRALIERDYAFIVKNTGENWDLAVKYYLSSLNIFKELEDWSGYGSVALELSRLYRERGSSTWIDAKKWGEEAVGAFSKSDSAYGIAKAKVELGLLLWLVGEEEEAYTLYNDALKIQNRLENKSEVGRIHAFLGRWFRKAGRWDEAESAFSKSLEQLTASRNQSEIAWTLNALGNLLTERGNYVRAQEMYLKSIEIRDILGQVYERAVTLKNLVELYGQLEDWSNAVKVSNEAISIFQELGSEQRIGEVKMNLGDVYLKQKSYNDALSNYLEALEIVSKYNYKDYIIRLKVRIAEIALIEGEIRKSKNILVEAISSSREGTTKYLVEAFLLLASISIHYFDQSDAISNYEKALSSASDLNDEILYQTVNSILADINTSLDTNANESTRLIAGWFVDRASSYHFRQEWFNVLRDKLRALGERI